MDVGNTNVTVGVFQDASLRATWRVSTDINKRADEYGVLMASLLAHDGIQADDISDAVMGSVVADLDPAFEAACRRCLDVKPLIVGTGARTGVSILCNN